MHKKYWLVAYKLGFAALVVAAVVTQLSASLQRPEHNVANFFSFFTIESNILGALIFAISAFYTLWGNAPKWLGSWRGAAALYMTITGIIYTLLLSGLAESLQTPIPWINSVLHYVFPAVVFLDWFIDRAPRIPFKKALTWLLFPLAYATYTLIRGPIVHWYPYPFLNPANGGYGHVFVTALGIALGIVAMVAVFTAYTHYGTKKLATATPSKFKKR